MDFFRIFEKEDKEGLVHLRPDWRVGRATDLMTRSGSFYAIWDEEAALWSTDIYDVQRLVDAELRAYAKRETEVTKRKYVVHTMESHNSKLWDGFNHYLRNSGDNSHTLDQTLTFADTETSKSRYASKRLGYSVSTGEHIAWDELVGTLYSDQERAKIEWAIGAVVSGKSTTIQKFLVFYGPPGSGKSTVLNVVQMLFEGYVSVFDARELAGSNNTFATAAFKSNPLVAIQHDGDLSKIVDNTKLNSIVAHEIMVVNEKYKAPRESRSRAFIFMGTNVPVKITDAKSGVLRRLIDVVPTGNTIDHDRYFDLMRQIEFELGAIAEHCQARFLEMNENFYSEYRPKQMMLQTDVFYNFVEDHLDVMRREEGVTLKQAYALYKTYCEETGIDRLLPQYKFREELRNYFDDFIERAYLGGKWVRSLYVGFKTQKQKLPAGEISLKPDGPYSIHLEEGHSILDEAYAPLPAQDAKSDGTPRLRWADVTTTLADIDTSEVHYVQIPEDHIVIDFDLTDEAGDKSLALNLHEASKWPPTYAEVSRGGQGIHLHYIYSGDVTELESVYSDGIEVKTLLGNASLRRKLTSSNNVTITTISSGLPKKAKPMISSQTVKSEKSLRELIARNLRKEVHPGTKPSVDFIHHILEEAYEAGMTYDVSDMQGAVLTFAAKSSHQSPYCIKLVQTMKFQGPNNVEDDNLYDEEPNTPLVFFDVEVYPNLFVICWKVEGNDEVSRMINPSSKEVEELMCHRLVGFNNRRYDNHILYGRFLGYDNQALYELSASIISGGNRSGAMFSQAYSLSYADVYDFSSKKQGLKKFEIELGIHHAELDLPWDEPVSEELIDDVVEYCVNDVVATEAVFLSRDGDWRARKILATLSGLTPNHSTQSHTARIIFGNDRSPQKKFVYTDLSDQFVGYQYDMGESTYRGEVTGEGGYVYAEPGCYENVVVLDIASMHPTSIIELNAFGPYTPKFQELMDARLMIKRGELDEARGYLGGKLAPFLEGDAGKLDELAYALKIVINSVYGLTSARFENPFKDPRNKDNIVAKRGALFMVDLKHFVQARGFTVVHIKTDSIKIPDATSEIIDAVTQFGEEYGYTFELENTYDRFCLVNDAVYVALEDGEWTTVGAQFQHPYVLKKCFTGEPIEFDDLCETRNVVQGIMYMDNSGTGEVEHMVHVGHTGSFVCVEDGGTLWRVKDNKQYAVTGTKGHTWIPRAVAKAREANDELRVDYTYYDALVEKAKSTIGRFADFTEFTN